MNKILFGFIFIILLIVFGFVSYLLCKLDEFLNKKKGCDNNDDNNFNSNNI